MVNVMIDIRYGTVNQKLGLIRDVCYFTQDKKQKRTLFLAIVSQSVEPMLCCLEVNQ